MNLRHSCDTPHGHPAAFHLGLPACHLLIRYLMTTGVLVQLQTECAVLQHLGATPACLPRALSGLLRVTRHGVAAECRGLLTQWQGVRLSCVEMPLHCAELEALSHCLLQAIAFLEVIALCFQWTRCQASEKLSWKQEDFVR